MQLETTVQLYEVSRTNSLAPSYGGLYELLSGSSGGGGSGFKPASSFGLGPGIARELKDLDIIERARYDGGDHINLEYLRTGGGVPLTNLHILLNDKGDKKK
ncbi:MAG: hypothetical protein WC413_01225 [Candidatus Nanoarchaeia archaeon]